jgi:hypothetical protein
MSRKKIQNRIEQLEPDDAGDDGHAFVLDMAYFEHEGTWPDGEDSPHPELTVKPHPEQKPNSLKIATPNILPEPYRNEAFVTIVGCSTKHKHIPESVPKENAPPTACELWNALDEDDLRREKAIREEEGEPIPDVLAEY